MARQPLQPFRRYTLSQTCAEALWPKLSHIFKFGMLWTNHNVIHLVLPRDAFSFGRRCYQGLYSSAITAIVAMIPCSQNIVVCVDQNMSADINWVEHKARGKIA